MTELSKRKRHDELPTVSSVEELQTKLRSAICTYESAEVALLYLIREYKFDSIMLQEVLKGLFIILDLRARLTRIPFPGDGLDVSFSKVKYESIAEFVGLDPLYSFEDAPTFELHRSRIPTSLFRRIVEDVDDMIMQYGPPEDHKTEESTSRFFSPVRVTLILVKPSEAVPLDLQLLSSSVYI